MAWVFFRAASMDDALLIFGKIGPGLAELTRPETWASLKSLMVLSMGGSKLRAALVLAALGAVQVVELLRDKGWATREAVSRQPVWVRWPLYYALVLATLLLAPLVPSRFIYFQF